MKDLVKISGSLENYKPKELVAAAAGHLLAVLAGILATKAVVSDKLLPFGLSFMGGVSLTYTPAAAIGVFIGYFIPAIGNGGFRYIAAMFAILAIKLLLGNYKKLVGNPVFLGSICFLASFLTSAVTLRGMGASITDVTSEAFLAAGGAYFISRCFKLLKHPAAGFTPDELVSLFVPLGILLIGLNRFSLSGIALGHILGVTLVLTAAKYGGIISGAIGGITAAFALSLSGAPGSISVVYAFAGLLAGVFSSYGKYTQVAVIMIFAFAGSAASQNPVTIAATVIETALGAALFLLLPRQAGITLSKLFSAYPKLVIPSGYKKSLTMRLNVAANALRNVSETVEQVSFELSKINSPDFGTVISAVEQDACAGCKLRVHCWESRRDDTVAAVLELTKAVKQGNPAPDSAAPEEFKGRCLRVSRVADSTYKHYAEYTSRIAAENRIDEVRSVVSDQFDGISSMLCDLADDFENDEQFDNSTAEKAAAALKNLNIRVDECSSRRDKFGRVSIELKIKKEPELVLNKLQIMKLVSVVCERDFDIPSVNEIENDIFLTLGEHADIRIDIGAEQSCASGSSMCGDAYKYFYDGRGHFIMVLSDGMGTGGRAAVDGAMASGLMTRLIKAGFGYDCSLRILNSSMLFKSTDESLATVDIASIDLYTGQTELYKAGAAPTVIRRSGRTGKAESSSLPAGILREIGFDKAAIKCRIGDIVVMMSDGAVTEGTDWIRDEIESWTDGSAQELAERLCEGAKRRRTDNHEDDITVMTAILNKAV